MQFFVQDVREWGNAKILSNFVKSARGEDAFFSRMNLQNKVIGKCSSIAFSLPREYKLLHDKIRNEYSGMEFFMNNCEPLILSMDVPGKSVQRRFRNQWNACWDSFGKSVNLSPETIQSLKELGVRICYSDASKVSLETFEFFNVVLKWFVYTSSEGSIQETGLTPTQLVKRLVVQEPWAFVHDVQVGF